PHLGLTPATAYRPVCQRDRNDQLASAQSPLPYEDWLNAQALSRQPRWGSQKAGLTFSLLTVIYARTPADLLRETGRSILTQSHTDFEWLILVNGDITQATALTVDELSADPRVCVLRSTAHIGIVQGLALCLREASGDYIAPMDADDLITPDALRVLG